MADKHQRSFVKVLLPEQNEGKSVREVLWVDSEDLDEVRTALAGRGLGVMGLELEDSRFQLDRPMSISELKRKYPTLEELSRTHKACRTTKAKRRPTMGPRKTR